MLLMMWVESSRCFPVRIPSAWMIRSVVSWKASRPPSCCIRRTRKLCSVFWGRWVSSISSRRAWCQSRLNSSCSRASSSVRLNISLRRWTPRTVCTARLGRPLSAQYIGAKRSSSIRGSASFRKTSAQLRSKRLAFFGGTRNSDCHRLTCGSRSRNMLTSPALVQHLAASPHYPCLASAWRGVFTNESCLVYNEIAVGGPDDLAEWAKQQRGNGFFIEPDQRVQAAYGAIAQYVTKSFPRHHADAFLNKADPWMIAHAMAHGGQVVTFERREPNSRKPKIPDVADAFGVVSTNMWRMLRTLGAQFQNT